MSRSHIERDAELASVTNWLRTAMRTNHYIISVGVVPVTLTLLRILSSRVGRFNARRNVRKLFVRTVLPLNFLTVHFLISWYRRPSVFTHLSMRSFHLFLYVYSLRTFSLFPISDFINFCPIVHVQLHCLKFSLVPSLTLFFWHLMFIHPSPQHYSSGWALASWTICFHSSLFFIFPPHPFSFILRRLSSASSNDLSYFADVDFRSIHPSGADCLVSEQFSFYSVRLLASRPAPDRISFFD
jgi:hypothetical protein